MAGTVTMTSPCGVSLTHSVSEQDELTGRLARKCWLQETDRPKAFCWFLSLYFLE